MPPSLSEGLEQLPLARGGRVVRRRLVSLEPRISGAVPAGIATAGGPPRDTIEMEVARLWEEMLGVHPVGVHDNFFSLGGHSFLAVRMMSAIQRRFGRAIPLATLFQDGT